MTSPQLAVPEIKGAAAATKRHKGVQQINQKYDARISHSGRIIFIGRFNTLKKAAYMYDLYARALRSPDSRKTDNGYFIDVENPCINKMMGVIRNSGWESLPQANKGKKRKRQKFKPAVKCAHVADVRFCAKCDGIYMCAHGKRRSFCSICSRGALTLCDHVTKNGTRRRRRTCLDCKVAGTGGVGRCNAHLLKHCKMCSQGAIEPCELGAYASAIAKRNLQEAMAAHARRLDLGDTEHGMWMGPLDESATKRPARDSEVALPSLFSFPLKQRA